MTELLGALHLTPDTTSAGIFANGLHIGNTPLTNDYLKQHRVEIMIMGEPTQGKHPDLFHLALHSIIIDGRHAYTFED
jgi:hypothetical protein